MRHKVFRIDAGDYTICAGLAEMRGFLAGCGLGADACGTAEIVLAEALNNIAEHAYANGGAGGIRVSLTVADGGMTAEIVDAGLPLPGLAPPAARLPPLGGATDTLPEGGFGWFLIRTLTEDIGYTRRGGENHLRLRLALDAAPLADRAG